MGFDFTPNRGQVFFVMLFLYYLLKVVIIFQFLFVFCVVANNFNSFLKLKFFKNVLAEILKINSFSSVAKTKKFKAQDCSVIFTK